MLGSALVKWVEGHILKGFNLYFLPCLLLFLPLFTFSDEAYHFRLLHFNDIYQLKEQHHAAGFAKLKNFIETEKAKKENVIVTFGGDLVPAAAGRIPVDLSTMFYFLNKLPIDYAVLGNHEFDGGTPHLKKSLKISKIKWLSANILDHKANKPLTPAYAVHEIKGKKIGIFGLTTEDTVKISMPGKSIHFLDYIQTARHMINKLEREKVDFIIALTHLSIAEDNKLAKACPQIDLILGGHDHQPYSYQIGKTLIHKSGVNGEYLGIIDITLNTQEGLRDVHFDWSMRSPKSADPDPTILAEINEMEANYLKKYNRPIARIEQDFTSADGHIRNYESKIGNLLADALRDHFDADAALINSGALRGNRNYYKGSMLTMSDILSELPFKNRVIKVEISGKKIFEFVQETFEKGNGSFPNLSGMHAVYNPKNKKLLTLHIKGAPIDPHRTYSLATVDYLVRGGDGITTFLDFIDEKDLPGNKIIAEVMIDYLQKIKIIKNMPYGRISFPRR